MHDKIRNDAFRTLATDQDFLDKVGEEKLIRCLEAFVWRRLGLSFPAIGLRTRSFDLLDASLTLSDLERETGAAESAPVPYVQGQNVLAAPFLYAMPSQLEAFACFTTFIEDQVPRYVRPTLVGVHDGLQVRL